jgi:eukaryotic-like serine/threonine-protein kinase
MDGGVTMLESGQLFAGDYRVVKPLSSGGMGAVYIAEQLSTGKQRALKLMHPQLIADPDLRRRFEQEAHIGARIESAHVVEVQAAGVDATSGIPWLVMELLAGEDMAKLLERDGALPAPEVREIFEQVCHAIGAAHRAHIIHRDLKPENIFIGRGRHAGARIEVKVLDFGIAKLAEESGTRGSTAAMGSPAWMAPEQSERAVIDARADVWALGLVAYCALTGRVFWRKVGETWLLLLREIMLEPLPLASQRAEEQGCKGRLPPGFDAWFARCVARDPKDRFANATELWQALLPVLSGAPAVAHVSSVPATVAEAPTVVALPPQGPLPLPPTPPTAPLAPVHVGAPLRPGAARSSNPLGVIVVIAVLVGIVCAILAGIAGARRRSSELSQRGARPLETPVLPDGGANAVKPPSPEESATPPLTPPRLLPRKPPTPSGGRGGAKPPCQCNAGDPLCTCL